MKVLQLCKKFPYPLKDGESLAVYYLSKSLVDQGCRVDLLSVNTPKHFFRLHDDFDKLPHYSLIKSVFIDTSVTLSGAMFNLFSSKSYHISRFESKDFASVLEGLLEKSEYDIILLESVFMAPYISTIRKVSNAKVILRAHNVEFLIWSRLAVLETQFMKRLYLKYLTSKLKRYEQSVLEDMDGLVPISPVDQDFFKKMGFSGPVFTYPIAIQLEDYQHRLPSKAPNYFSVSFIGSLDWQPNQEGLFWFVRKVWPLVLASIPQAVFHIAGRHTPESIRALASPSIIVHGEVESVSAFLHAHALTVVPLLSGSGMRVKIIESMALGPVVVSTTIGAEGIRIEDNEIILVDQPDEMALNITNVLSNIQAYDELSVKARELVASEYDATQLGAKMRFWLSEIVSSQEI